jgi:hypothetical protein
MNPHGSSRDQFWIWSRWALAIAVTALLLLALTASGVLPSLTEALGKGDNGKAASAQYQYRPGWGCGDQNHTHTGPPGNQYREQPPGCFH